MDVNKIKTPAGYCKLAIIILGIVVMGVGLHSHFQSFWRKNDAYKYCDLPGVKNCPSISLEQYYVAIVIITFILSILNLVVTLIMDTSSLKMVDVGYHAVSAVLLFIGAIVYFVSADQINKHFSGKTLKGEKIFAGVLTLVQTVLYGITSFFILRG